MDIYDAQNYIEFMLLNVQSDFERMIYRKVIFDRNAYKRLKYLPNVPGHCLYNKKFKNVVKALQLLFSVKVGLNMQKSNLSEPAFSQILTYFSTVYDMMFEMCVYYDEHKQVDSQMDMEQQISDEKIFYLATELIQFVRS